MAIKAGWTLRHEERRGHRVENAARPRLEVIHAPGGFQTTLAAVMTIAAIMFSRSAPALSLSAQPGLWKLEATSGSLRVPVTQCVTGKDMADPQRVANVFGHPFNPMTNRRSDPGYHTLAEQAQQTCEYRDEKEAPDSLTFKLQCKGSFSSTEEGSLKFDTPSHYSGVFTFVGDDEMDVRPASPTISTEGSRIGDCTDSTVDSSSRH